MISLSDAELAAISDAARPLPHKARSEFLQAVAAELEHQEQRGPGVVYRACRELQKKYFDPPQFHVRANTTERIRQKVPTEKNKPVKRYDVPALPLARKFSLIEPRQHCDRLRTIHTTGGAGASTPHISGCGEEAPHSMARHGRPRLSWPLRDM